GRRWRPRRRWPTPTAPPATAGPSHHAAAARRWPASPRRTRGGTKRETGAAAGRRRASGLPRHEAGRAGQAQQIAEARCLRARDLAAERGDPVVAAALVVERSG